MSNAIKGKCHQFLVVLTWRRFSLVRSMIKARMMQNIRICIKVVSNIRAPFHNKTTVTVHVHQQMALSQP